MVNGYNFHAYITARTPMVYTYEERIKSLTWKLQNAKSLHRRARYSKQLTRAKADLLALHLAHDP